jgi:phosphoglycolate phosphatase-like HAD superfamily hydrolase
MAASRPDTLVLDVDGTLLDSTYHHAVAWHRALHAHDVHVALWQVHRAIGLGGDRLPAHVAGEEVERRLGDVLRDRWESEYESLLPEVRPVTGAGDVVRALHQRGWRVAVASSGPRRNTEASLETVGITDLVTGIASAKDVETSKPAPDVLLAAVAEAGGEAGLLVGDSPWDGRSAAEAGYPWVGVRTGGFSAAELEEAGAALVVDGIGDLRDHLDDDLLAVGRP